MAAGMFAVGAAYFNPDVGARRMLTADPSLTQEQANIAAWRSNVQGIETTIRTRGEYAFETTLGGATISALLEKAAAQGIQVNVAYVGLTSLELHIARVRTRVAHGGHDIPEDTIRQRYARSILNLVRLLPILTELLVYDNSAAGDPQTGMEPRLFPVLHLQRGKILYQCDLNETPEWAKPVLFAALNTAK